MSWDKINDEKPRKEFRDRVLSEARREMERLKAVDGEVLSPWLGLRRRLIFAGAAMAGLALVFRSKKMATPDSEQDVLAMDTEMLENADMLKRLDFFEDLDVLETWTGKHG